MFYTQQNSLACQITFTLWNTKSYISDTQFVFKHTIQLIEMAMRQLDSYKAFLSTYLYEGEQWREHNCNFVWEEHSWKLVTQGLSRPSWHHHQNIVFAWQQNTVWFWCKIWIKNSRLAISKTASFCSSDLNCSNLKCFLRASATFSSSIFTEECCKVQPITCSISSHQPGIKWWGYVDQWRLTTNK